MLDLNFHEQAVQRHLLIINCNRYLNVPVTLRNLIFSCISHSGIVENNRIIPLNHINLYKIILQLKYLKFLLSTGISAGTRVISELRKQRDVFSLSRNNR